ncbi:hypothetical protein ACFQBQ_05010 [Granulicella cerasi]|uniref:Uncharacterized protein n=1 Tax=Granulicella cerasi TaxID=741063 RepID=A0ABW1Z961_9BACT|nr:hypothetical protein [Granulicella cerasi]
MTSFLGGLVCRDRSKAAKEYQRRAFAVMLCYVGCVWSVTRMLHAHHFTGAKLWCVAMLPAVPILGLLAVVGLYLRDERDEFKRWMTVQAILWSIGITLAVSTVVDFLRAYGAMTALPPLVEFLIFWGSMAVVQLVLKLRNRVKDDE